MSYERFVVTCFHEVRYHGIYAAAFGVAQYLHTVAGKVVRRKDARGYGVFDIVVDICAAVGEFDDFAFESAGRAAVFVIDDPVAYFVSEIESLAVVFEQFDDAQALFVVFETTLDQFVKNLFSRVPERRMTEVVPQRDSFGQIFVEAQGARCGAPYLRDFERMREPRTVMIAFGGYEDLRFVFEPAKGLAVDDPVAVPYEFGAHRTGLRRADPACGIARLKGIFAQKGIFALVYRQFVISHTSIISETDRAVKRECKSNVPFSAQNGASGAKTGSYGVNCAVLIAV